MLTLLAANIEKMAGGLFYFRHFIIHQDHCAMKVGTDSMLLGALLDCAQAQSILDIGTGTGVVALMLAQRSKGHIDAVELVQEAAAQATQNASNSMWANRIQVYNCPIQQYQAGDKRYDLIVSNPPYFEPHQAAQMKHDRLRARASTSLDFKELIKEAERLLTGEGVFAVIIPYAEKEHFIALCGDMGLYLQKEINIRSYANTTIVRCILQFSFVVAIELQATDFCIYESRGKYSSQYISLTKAYHARDMEASL